MIGRRTFLALAGGTLCSRAAGQAVAQPTVTSKVVRRLRRISPERRKRLEANPENRPPAELNKLIPEIDEIELVNIGAGIARGQVPKTLRVIAWNTERGRFWREGVQLIQETPALRDPDIVLLGEMDMGMARSGNVHTTQLMAAALKMNYLYGVEFLEFTGGEPQERKNWPGPNAWGYHGNAILSRFPLMGAEMVRFPGIEKWYKDYQKRLGGRMALVASIRVGDEHVVLVSVHLESSKEDSAARKAQTDMLLQVLGNHDRPLLLGGDLNAAPDEPMFEAVRHFGFRLEDSNELKGGTLQRVVDGKFVMENYYIDYLLVRGLKVMRNETSPKVVAAVYPPGSSQLLADHAIVTARIELP